MKKHVFLFAVGCFSVSAAHAATPRSVNAEEFDVAGVKLGMSAEVALKSVLSKFGVGKDVIEFDSYPQVNPVTNRKEYKHFSLKTGGASLSVHFEPAIPYNATNPMIVSMVSYEQEWTQANVLAMKDLALKKYGEPSNGTIGVAYQWCLEPHSNLGFGCSEYRGAVMSLSATKLQLSDPRYRQAVIDYMNKRLSLKPAF